MSGGRWDRRMSRAEASDWGIEPSELEGQRAAARVAAAFLNNPGPPVCAHRYRAPEVYLVRGDEVRSAGAVGVFRGVLRVDGRIAHVRVAYS